MKVDYFINNKERSHYCISEKKALKKLKGNKNGNTTNRLN